MADVKVKVCGITNANDARLAFELGAAMLGLNFYPRSPRYITAVQARPIIATVPASVERVGVFVNAALEEIVTAVAATGVGAVQLHGDETVEFCRRLKQRLPGVRIIKAFRTDAVFAPETVASYNADAVLIDAACTDFGGSGLKADWERARVVASLARDTILAGGLHAGNVTDAIRSVRPTTVDVCSGVESIKGRKDPARMHAFFAAVREANGIPINGSGIRGTTNIGERI